MNENGPRLYNSESPQAREARLRARQARMEKAIHRRRRRVILAVFGVVIIFFGVQIGMKASQTKQINSQVQASNEKLKKTKVKNVKLTNQRDDLKDPNYVAKLVRYKFYYTKQNEKVYNVPEENGNSN